MLRRSVFLLNLVLLALSAHAADRLVYVGSYTQGPGIGISLFHFDDRTGKLTSAGLAAETSNPSFLVEHPNHRFLYSVNEDQQGGVSAFAIDRNTGKLTLLNKVPSGGNGPCHLAVDKTGHWLAVANYGSGDLALLPIAADGKLSAPVFTERHPGGSVNPARQQGPHAHCVLFSPDNRFLLLADLGHDKIFVYRFDAAAGSLKPQDPGTVAPGAGVRHLAFHPNGRVLYAVDEMGSSITAFHYDAGALSEFQTISTVPKDFKGRNSGAEIAVNAAGTAVYSSNRGQDSIALFAVDPERLTLTAVDHTPTLGRTPRHFTLDPSGTFLLAANQDSDSIAVFHVHPRTGQLTPAGKVVTGIPKPVCILFLQ